MLSYSFASTKITTLTIAIVLGIFLSPGKAEKQPLSNSSVTQANEPILNSDTMRTDLHRYNVIWNSPSKDASGVMPIGNGDIGAGVYAIENGDLYLLLSKNDAYTYQGDLFKTGRVRISLNPNPFTAGKPFRQELDLATGSIRIEADGVKLRI